MQLLLLYRSWGLGSNMVSNSAGRRGKSLLLFFCYSCYLFKKTEGKTEGKQLLYIQDRRPHLPARPDKNTRERNVTQKLSKT